MSQGEVNGRPDPWKKEREFWNSTITTLSHGARDLWRNPRVTMIRIEIFVSAVAAALFLLAIFGSQRRRSRNGFLQKGAFGAFVLSFPVATYVLGSMQSSGVKSSMYPIWAISLIMLHGCADSITAYSVDDHKQRARLIYQAYMYTFYAVLLLISVQTDYTRSFIYMVVIAYVRYAQRLAASALAGYSWNWNKIVVDYMYEEQNKVIGKIEDCSYLVEWPISKSKFGAPTYATQLTADREKDEVIDIRKIWQCEDLSSVPDLKDACLSFSLFHLLRSRCFGFAYEESKDRAHDFVFKGLLSDGAGVTDYNWVFKVIGVELAYMYDFFFTKYAVIYYGSMAATVWSLISIIGISITAYITVRAPLKISQGGSDIASTVTDDVVITLVILLLIALLEFLQLLFFWMGIWGRVSFVCQSIREQARFNRNKTSTGESYRESLAKIGASYIMGLKGFLAKNGVRFAPNKHYWRHRIGQYSLLDSVSYNPSPSILAILYHNRLMTIVGRMVYLVEFPFIHPINSQALKIRRKAEKSVELPDEIKKEVICSLKSTGGTLSNGKSSLESNREPDLLWACGWEMHPDPSWSQRKQNQTHIILTWHIATWYCEMVTLSPDAGIQYKTAFGVATKLSKYCAYLVVNAPKLLPGHPYDTIQKFDAAAVEAVTFLQRVATAEEAKTFEQRAKSIYEGMKRLTVPKETKTIFDSGIKLGRQLEDMEEGKRWQVMADFWAEMMLYLAPSDNVKEHIEQLAQGGEFITHLWALLSHAGILGRDQEHPAGSV